MEDTANLPFTFRKGLPQDASDLAIFADTATGGLSTHLWRGVANPGQSAMEVGRDIILNVKDSPIYHGQWLVAESRGKTVGAMLGFRLGEDGAPVGHDAVLAPLNALKSRVGGTWFLSLLTVVPEARSKGVATALLGEVPRLAGETGATEISLILSSPNTVARRIYEKQGYSEAERETLVPYPGSHPEGDWILMMKAV